MSLNETYWYGKYVNVNILSQIILLEKICDLTTSSNVSFYQFIMLKQINTANRWTIKKKHIFQSLVIS